MDWTSSFERSASGPLTGVVVADFSRVLAGPYCTMLLADLGATVLKVESHKGDETRSWRPPTYRGASTYFQSINRNKLSIALDFDDPTDLEVAQRIAAEADVLVENFKPGSLQRFRLDYGSVVLDNPEVVYASITGFGTGGGAELPGYDLLVQALSGLMSTTGSPETGPFRAGVAVFDVMTGLHAGMGVLAAVHHRDRTGKGQLVEVNLMSSALSGMPNLTGGYVLTGEVPQRIGNEHPSIYPYAPFDTAQGQIILAIGNDAQFRRFCVVIDAPELAVDPRFATNGDRSINRDELRPLLLRRLETRSAETWFRQLTAAKLPCAPILDVQAGVEFAKEIGLDPVVHSGRERQAGIRNPIRMSRTPASYDLAPPELGNGDEVIRAWLGAREPREATERHPSGLPG